MRQHKNTWRERRAIGIVAAGHRARCHGGYLVVAVHGVFGRMLVMMALNRALASRTAGVHVSRESNRAERRVEESDREQTENREKRARAIVKAIGHG